MIVTWCQSRDTNLNVHAVVPLVHPQLPRTRYGHVDRSHLMATPQRWVTLSPTYHALRRVHSRRCSRSLSSLSPFPKMLFSRLRPPPARSPSVDPQFISNHELGKGLCCEVVDPLSPLFSFRFFFWYWSILICTQPVRLEYLGRC